MTAADVSSIAAEWTAIVISIAVAVVSQKNAPLEFSIVCAPRHVDKGEG